MAHPSGLTYRTFDARSTNICRKAAAMDATNYLNPKTRDEHVARYITQGLHALCVHSGMRALSEGEEVELNFEPEIYALGPPIAGACRSRSSSVVAFELTRTRLFSVGSVTVGTGRKTVAARAALVRLHAQGLITSLARGSGLCLIVPPEHADRAPPVLWWLHDFLCKKEESYQLALLSAAQAHGSSHFAVLETQILYPRPVGSSRWVLLVCGFLLNSHSHNPQLKVLRAEAVACAIWSFFRASRLEGLLVCRPFTGQMSH
ncbi:hypothetical protein OKW40_003656 [Paraburkholderia sp. RAU6.4a]